MSSNELHSPRHNWMAVYTTYDITDAHVVAGRLEVDGIPCMVYKQAGAAAFGITFGRFGEVQVLVNEPDYERALMLLDYIEPNSLPDTTDDINYRWEDDDIE